MSEMDKSNDQEETKKETPVHDDALVFTEQEEEESVQEIETAQEDEVAGPVVDPSGTFTNWKGLNDSGLKEGIEGVEDSDYLPPPKLDNKGYSVLHPNLNVTLPTGIYSVKKPVHKAIPFYAYLGNEAELLNTLTRFEILEKRKSRKTQFSEHEESIALSFQECIPDQYFWKAQFKEGSKWTNVPMHDKQDLAMRPLTGTGLTSTFQQEQEGYRLGLPINIPLWHSGFHARLYTPTAKQFAILDSVIASEKNIFGRRTSGAVFSTTRCYMENAIKDMFKDCLRGTNIVNWTDDLIDELLDSRDIQSIATALSASRYPVGYPIVEPCLEIEAGCNEVKHSSINLVNMLVVDESRLTPEQWRHMGNRLEKRTVDQVKAYQASASWNSSKTISPSTSISIRLKVPTLNNLINSGFVWAAEINAEVGRVLGENSPTRERSILIENLITSASLRSFSPFFESIITGGKEQEMTPELLSELIERIGDDRQIVRRIELDIRNFVDDNIIAFMALPRYLCPKCETRLQHENPERLKEYMLHPILVPQDAVTRFFTLRSQG